MIDILTSICNKSLKTGKWPTTWTESLVITLPKKGNLQLCQNYMTISLISHPSKVMLKGIQNRLQPQAEEIIAEEQAGFRAGRITKEQIFNLRILCEKNLQHQQNLYDVFIYMNVKNRFLFSAVLLEGTVWLLLKIEVHLYLFLTYFYCIFIHCKRLNIVVRSIQW